MASLASPNVINIADLRRLARRRLPDAVMRRELLPEEEES